MAKATVEYSPDLLQRARERASAAGYRGSDFDDYVREYCAGYTEAAQAAAKETRNAVLETRQRIGTILRSEEANGREEFASHLAFESDQPAIVCIELLKRVPKTEGTTPLARAMAAVGRSAVVNQEVTGDAGGPSTSAEIFAKRKQSVVDARARASRR